MHFKLFVMLTGSLLFSQSAHSQVNSTNHGERSDDISECVYVHGYLVGNRTKTKRCCNVTVKYFERRWSIGRQYLTNYLETLRGWKCPRFEEECKQRLFNYTEYTQNVYKYFCEYETFVDSCFDEVKEAFMRNNNHDELQTPTVATGTNNTNDNSIYTQWNSIISRLQANSLSSSDLSKPCVQVALYEADEDHLGDYHEVIHVNLPSCEVVWCGYDGETLRERIISSWTCMSSSCRAKMVAIMVFCVLLGIVITTVNILVIAAITRNVGLRHSQGIYKISLAIADLIVGLFVFPTFAASLGRLVTFRHKSDPFINATGYLEVDGILGEGVSVETRFRSLIPTSSRSYNDSVGFFTVLSLTVSVYTLAVAGFDRFWVVSRPLSYSKDKARTCAKILCVVTWLFGILVSVLPFLSSNLTYVLLASILVASGGQDALILYIVGFLIPLLIMWSISIATYISARKYAKVRQQLTADSRKLQSIETRLARTLGLMVGIFTLSILPVALVILSSLFVGTIYFSQPRRVDVQGALVYNTFEFISIIILSCNSLWNFFIYNGRNLEFRNEVKTMIKSIFKKLSLARCCQSKTIDDQRAVAVKNARPTPSTPASLDSKEETLKRCSLASSANRLNTNCTVLDQSPDIIRRNPNLCTFLGSDGKSETSIDKLDLKIINRNQVDSPHLIETNTPGCKVESGFSKEDNPAFVTDANADETSLSCINKTNDMVSARPTETVRTSLDEEIA